MGSRTERAVEDRLIAVVVLQHDRLRSLFRDAAHADPSQRDAACERLVGYLALHAAAEREALCPPGDRPGDDVLRRRADEDRALDEAVERLGDLGTSCRSYRVQLALLAAAAVRHVHASEAEEIPRFVVSHEDAELARAVDLQSRVRDGGAVDERALQASLACSFRNRFRRLRSALRRSPRTGVRSPTRSRSGRTGAWTPGATGRAEPASRR